MKARIVVEVDIRDRALRRDDILDAVAVGAQRELNWRARGCVRDLTARELEEKPLVTQTELL